MGAGGSFGYCDSEVEIAYSYVTNRCGQVVVDDPREFALRTKVYEAVQKVRQLEGSDLPNLDLDLVNSPHFLAQRYRHPELKLLLYIEKMTRIIQ